MVRMNKTVKRLRDACKVIAHTFSDVADVIDDLSDGSRRAAAAIASCTGHTFTPPRPTTHVRIRTRLLRSGMYVAQIRRADTNGWIWSSPYCTYDFTAVRHAQNKAAEMGWVTDAAPEFRHTPVAANTCSPVRGCR